MTMTKETYQAELLLAYHIVEILCSAPLEELRQLQEHAEALGPMLDPTAYITNGRKFHEDMAAVTVLTQAKAKLVKAFPTLAERAAGFDREVIRGAAAVLLDSLRVTAKEK